VTAAHVDEAIQYVGPELRHGRVYFDAHERELVESCGHYMLYGSEYVTAVAAHIQGPRDYRQALKTRGTPTVFVCDVPIAAMHSDAVEEFAGIAVKVLFKRLLDPTFEHPQPHDGGGICIRRALPANRIIRHYHPTHIADPFLGNLVTSI